MRQEDCEPSAVDTALTYISYIGTSISIVCLVFTSVFSKQEQGKNYNFKVYGNFLTTEIDAEKLTANESEAMYY